MNFRKVIKAMAVIGLVSFGSQALATWTTTASDNFDSYDEGLFEPLAGLEWTVDLADLSEIASVGVSEFDAAGNLIPGDGVTSKVLALNTEGNELAFAAGPTGTAEYATVLVDMLVQMVGSDDGDPELGDVRTAVYLDTTVPEAPVLKGYTAAGWIALDGVTVQENEWISLKIEIDFETGFDTQEPRVSYVVNGFTLTDGEAVPASSFIVANTAASFSQGNIAEVVFQGTGAVEDLFVKEQPFSIATATIIRDAYDADGLMQTFSTQQVALTGTYNWSFELATGSHVLDRVELLGSDGTTVLATLAGIEDVPENLIQGEFDLADVITGGLLADQTYYVRGTYVINVYELFVAFVANDAGYTPANYSDFVTHGEDFVVDVLALLANTTDFAYENTRDLMLVEGGNPEAVTVAAVTEGGITLTIYGYWLDPSAPEDDIEFDPVTPENPDGAALVFDDLDLATGVVSFTAKGVVNATESFTMYLIVTEGLVNGPDFTIAVEVLADDVAGDITGTATITLGVIAGYDTLFIKGLSTEAPAE